MKVRAPFYFGCQTYRGKWGWVLRAFTVWSWRRCGPNRSQYEMTDRGVADCLEETTMPMKMPAEVFRR